MSDVLAALGLLAAATGAAGAILLPAGRLRSLAMLAALVLFPVLILGDQWHSHQIVDLRHSTGRLVALGLVGGAVTAALAYVFRRWPVLLPLAIVAALPFRVPLHSGGDTANLLVPLYLVIAGGVLATTLRTWRASHPLLPGGGTVGGPAPEDALATAGGGGSPAVTGPAGPSAWLPRVLAAVVVLYAVQVLYSEDFSKGLQNTCFFFVPFSLVYGLLREVKWDRRLLALVLWVVGIEAVCFVLVGSVEFVTKSLFWNDQVIRSNEFHTYFRVNSVFWDPNIYGRYLSLVAVVAMSALLWARERKTLALLTALIAVLWIGLVPTFSQSSFAALLAGLVVLAALRWSLKWTAIAAVGGVVLTMLIVTLAGSFSFDRINIDTSGRANLVSGGVHLFTQRPIYGYGSGSFPKAYRKHVKTRKAPVSVSHTEPITVAAEQGFIGLALYAALVVTALWTMSAGLRPSLSRLAASRAGGTVGGTAPEDALATGGGGGSPAVTGPARQVARVAVLATFVALIVHTMAYAGFYEDPITWVLLAAGASLAAAQQRRVEPCPDTSAA
ncbi:MAG TPA: O-antigen ligase family protein [Solirubrobacterales bacterium]|nr:O-antigen ligase family protein [Solirubrobacterales bacterium]